MTSEEKINHYKDALRAAIGFVGTKATPEDFDEKTKNFILQNLYRVYTEIELLKDFEDDLK
jgi:hypothetical protein